MAERAPTVGWRSERLSLAMVAASLCVIAVIIGLLFIQQRAAHEQRLRVQGVGLVRLLSSTPFSRLVTEEPTDSAIQAVRYSGGDFAYVAVIDAAGRTLAEVTAPGLIVPYVEPPSIPSTWLGERVVEQGTAGRHILEFHAPLLEERELAGFVRLGYFQPRLGLSSTELSFLATLALPIFLLVPLFHVLLRREIRPLREANSGIAQLLEDGQLQQVDIRASGELADFIGRFNRLVELAQERVEVLETGQRELETSTKLLSYKKARIERVLEALPEAVLVLDEAGTVSFANGKTATLLGVERENVLEGDPSVWCEEPQLLELLRRCHGKFAPGSLSGEIEFSLPRAPDRTVSVTAYPLFSPTDSSSSFGTLIVLRDVTQEALARRSRGEFVAHVAHELKTPLQTLTLYSEQLMSTAGQKREVQVEAVNVIHDEVDRLAGLIDNLLSITQIENGSLELNRQRVKLGELLRDAFDGVVRSARREDVEFELDLPRELPSVQVDKDLLRIAINNLLTNAIKYNRPGGTVYLGVDQTQEMVQIRVRDSGIGIDPEERPRIFEKFYRSADPQVRERTGHGLGLPLAREIVELHGGNLLVSSAPGEGSEFVIELWKGAGLMQKAG